MLCLGGCTGGQGGGIPVSEDLVTQLTVETERLATLLWGRSLLSLLLTLLIGLLLSRLLDTSVRLAWRLGLDHRHRLTSVRRWGNVAIAMGVAVILLRRLFDAAPVMAGLLTIASGAGLVLALARPLQNAFAGLMLILRGRIREGDHLELADHAGTVRELGLLRLRVRDAEGQTVLIPNRLLGERVVTVTRTTHHVPVTLRLPLAAGGDRDLIERARRAALLSPWRVPGTPARAWIEDDQCCLAVEMQTWSEGAVHSARGALDAAVKPLTEAPS